MKEINTNLIDKDYSDKEENSIDIPNQIIIPEGKDSNDIAKDKNEIEEDKEKKRLIEKLEIIKNQMQEKGKISIKDVYLTYSEEQFLELKKEKINDFLEFLYKFLFFIIITIYLVGSFLIISLKKSFFNLFITSLKCRLELFVIKKNLKNKPISLYIFMSNF